MAPTSRVIALSLVRPAGRTHLEVEVLYGPGKGNRQPNGKGVVGDCESEGSRRQSAGLTNRKRMRRRCGVRRPISSKPGTCTERNDVYPTGISVKVGVQYPGRSGSLPERATGVDRRGDGGAEVSRGHSRCGSCPIAWCRSTARKGPRGTRISALHRSQPRLGSIAEGVQAFKLHVATLQGPLVALLQQHGAHQPGDRLVVGVRRLISALSRSSGLVEWICSQWALGKSM